MSQITNVKQANLIDADKVGNWTLRIFGIGSIGSITVKQAALAGFDNIIGYDFDEVEDENIGSQEFWGCHVGMKKTDAIVDLMKKAYDFDVQVVEGEITPDSDICPESDTIYFCAFDSLEARKLLWDKIRAFPVVWAETRIGRTAQRYYIIDLRDDSEENLKRIEEYEKSLDPQGPRTELKCGEKGTYPANAELVGCLMRQFVNIAEGKDFATLRIGDWGMPPPIFVMPEQEVPSEIVYDDPEPEEGE